jgi:ubiquinone/menaquinone biosynthesis C-methylase UbiE
MEKPLGQPNFPEIYERVLVPGKFGPWARDLIERARPIGPSERLLDLGCGTGIVARLLRERLGGAASIVGVDMNPQMIAHARTLAPELDWREGSAMALPFADGAFDLVLCQEMLQFAPDRAVALREIRRVLSPGGRLVASTWRPRSEHALYDAICQVAERYLGTSADKRFSLGDGQALRTLLVEAGFSDVRVQTVTLTEHHREILVRLNAMAMSFDLSSLSDLEREARMSALEAESMQVLARFATPDGFEEPVSANVATATAPST